MAEAALRYLYEAREAPLYVNMSGNDSKSFSFLGRVRNELVVGCSGVGRPRSGKNGASAAAVKVTTVHSPCARRPTLQQQARRPSPVEIKGAPWHNLSSRT